MRKKICVGLALMLGLLFGIVLTVSGQFNGDVSDAVFVSSDAPHLTIYENGIALVRDTRTFELQAGLNRVTFTGVSALMWRDSLAFGSLSNPQDTYAVEQSFATAEPPFSIDQLVAENVGQTIGLTVETRSGESHDYDGVLLSASGGKVVVQLADGTIVTLNQEEIRAYRLPNFREDRIEVPVLTLLVYSAEAGEQTLAITYLSDGVRWQNASYNLHLAADEESLNITGWITITNTSGVQFEEALVTLAAGDFDRLQFVTQEADFGALPTATPPGTSTPAPAGTPAYQLQPADFLLDLPRPVTLPSGEPVLIEFLSGAKSDVRNVYVYDASPRVYGYSGFITDPAFAQTDITTVRHFLAFSTGQDGVGTALPAGNLRIYQDSETGASLLIGQTPLAFTPEDETVQVFLDNPDDITGSRTQTEFLVPSPSAIQEEFDVYLRNDSDRDVTIVVPERMTRAAQWEILGASEPYTQPDQFGIEFVVDVPAGGETTIGYIVLYTNPQ